MSTGRRGHDVRGSFICNSPRLAVTQGLISTWLDQQTWVHVMLLHKEKWAVCAAASRVALESQNYYPLKEDRWKKSTRWRTWWSVLEKESEYSGLLNLIVASMPEARAILAWTHELKANLGNIIRPCLTHTSQYTCVHSFKNPRVGRRGENFTGRLAAFKCII